jgi:hypothetical protein
MGVRAWASDEASSPAIIAAPEGPTGVATGGGPSGAMEPASRRVRYGGEAKVFVQEAMACTAMNIKRLVRLVYAPTPEVCGPE